MRKLYSFQIQNNLATSNSCSYFCNTNNCLFTLSTQCLPLQELQPIDFGVHLIDDSTNKQESSFLARARDRSLARKNMVQVYVTPILLSASEPSKEQRKNPSSFLPSYIDYADSIDITSTSPPRFAWGASAQCGKTRGSQPDLLGSDFGNFGARRGGGEIKPVGVQKRWHGC